MTATDGTRPSAAAQPARERYRPIVEKLLPGADAREIELRCSIMLMRDRTAATMLICGDDAYPILAITGELAARYAMVPMAASALEGLRYNLLRMVTCASGIETFAALLAGAENG